MKNDKNKSINPADLPQDKVFTKKDPSQYPQPADTGLPIKDEEKTDLLPEEKEANRTSKEQGINEERSAGRAGAFEGFEDQEGK